MFEPRSQFKPFTHHSWFKSLTPVSSHYLVCQYECSIYLECKSYFLGDHLQIIWAKAILDWLLPLRHGISETDEAWRFKGAKEFFVLLFWLFSSSAWMSCATLCQTDIIWENFSLWCLHRLKIHCTLPIFCWIITLPKVETRSISYTHKIYLEIRHKYGPK